MPALARTFLLVSAIFCGGFFALLGGSFSRAAEPDQYTATTFAFWFVMGTVFTAPLWIPALMPARYPFALKVCRLVSAVALLLPTYLFGSIVAHNISRSLSGLGATPSALIQGALLTCTCVSCLLVLLWPELKTYAKRTT